MDFTNPNPEIFWSFLSLGIIVMVSTKIIIHPQMNFRQTSCSFPMHGLNMMLMTHSKSSYNTLARTKPAKQASSHTEMKPIITGGMHLSLWLLDGHAQYDDIAHPCMSVNSKLPHKNVVRCT